ncbi:PREDICTED: uncharacterized protein LOC104805079 [Tarenaya hassleriana]|uniref:uncharacterized protein LOC104805079 n=1 Tax=Tarenaya hassleriana TaxID=28532 RepID=UPI00053C0B3B|nr:PREDICTED: uncharacterized protein LOC104805079 [Tarenaya hassleriana]
MAQKHLRELLLEDQEPFQLHHYISDRRCQIGRPCLKTDLQVDTRKPISRNPRFPSNLCETSCFFSCRSSPDPRKSPLFELRSPGKLQNRVFLQVPTRTAAILLEAAARIQRQSSKNLKSKARNRGNGFGLFGSVFKRLTNRNPTRNTETQFSQVKLRLQNAVGDKSSCSRRTNAVFSERGGSDSDSQPSSSRSSRGGESFKVFDGFRYGNADAGDFSGCVSPFRFVLQTSPSSSGDQTPHFTSPAASPSRRSTKDEDSDETERLETQREQEEEEDKEQCSPVSVLDPSLEEEEEEEEEEEDDLQCSLEVVQRAQRRLLQKLRRFERLARLDPMELERNPSDETLTLYDSEEDLDEEDLGDGSENEREIGRRETERRVLKMWKYKGRGIDGIVERELGEEDGEWTRRRREEEVQEAASRLELSIFSSLVDEFSLELVSCPYIN